MAFFRCSERQVVPFYQTTGTLFSQTTITGTHSIDVPAHNSGDLHLLVVLLRNTNNNGSLDAINTSNWTQLGGVSNTYGGTQNTRMGFGYKIGDGSETTCSITASGGTGTSQIMARIYTFRRSLGFASTPVANIGGPNTGGITTDLTFPTVTPSGNYQLAVVAWGVNGNVTISEAVNETGGNYTIPIAQSSSSRGAIGIQVSNQDTGAAISGATAAASVGATQCCLGFTLVPA